LPNRSIADEASTPPYRPTTERGVHNGIGASLVLLHDA
jgi:hypothetical protein